MTIIHSKDTKFLGLWLDDRLNWNKHCSMLITKLKRNQALIRITKNLFSQNTLKQFTMLIFKVTLIMD